MQNEYSNFLSFCYFYKGRHVRYRINWVQYYHLMLYLNSHFLLVNTENNADPYIIKPPSLSSTRERDDHYTSAMYTIFMVWTYIILPHQNNVMDHSWPLVMDHICKNKKTCLYVHKTTSAKLSRLSNPPLGKGKRISFIFLFYPLSFTN